MCKARLAKKVTQRKKSDLPKLQKQVQKIVKNSIWTPALGTDDAKSVWKVELFLKAFRVFEGRPTNTPKWKFGQKH